MLVKNTTGGHITLRIDGVPGQPPRIVEAEPGSVVEVADGYCVRVPGAGGRTQKPIVERAWPGMKVLPQKDQAKILKRATDASGGSTPDEQMLSVMARLEGLEKQAKERDAQAGAAVAAAEDRARKAEAELGALREQLAKADRGALTDKAARAEADRAAKADAKAEKAAAKQEGGGKPE